MRSFGDLLGNQKGPEAKTSGPFAFNSRRNSIQVTGLKPAVNERAGNHTFEAKPFHL
jgi:hypothetical protein